MCKCNPERRTPWCPNCLSVSQRKLPSETNYEEVVKLLKETLDMLEYSHITGEWAYDHNRVSEFIADAYKQLEDL